MKQRIKIAKSIVVVILVIMAGLSGKIKTPVKAAELDESIQWPTGPDISADAAIVMEASTGSILYEKDIYGKYYPASTTKVLTTLVALENSELNEVVTVSYAAENYVSKSSSRMGLVEGEQLTMEEALYGIMLESANEATYAVGEHVGGSIPKFIKMMNRKASELGCEHSHFANSHGLHDDDHYTCCYDMALISQAAFISPMFRKITQTATYAMPATNKNPERLMTNHHNFINRTIKYDYCIGGKTGATTQAGYALVTYAKKDGMTLISVVMHAVDWNAVYADTKTLLDFAYENYNMYNMEDTGEEDNIVYPSLFEEKPAFMREGDKLLGTGEGGSIILPNGVISTQTKKRIELNPEVELEHGNNTIGEILYTYGDKVVGKADIIYFNKENPITEKSFRSKWPRYMIPIDVVYGSEETDDVQGTVNSDGDMADDGHSTVNGNGVAEGDNQGEVGVGQTETERNDNNAESAEETKGVFGFIKDNLPIVVGIGSGVVVVLVLLIILAIKNRGRRRRRY